MENSYLLLFRVLSRPGPQISRSGALSWIQCKLGKQYLCKKLPSGNRTHVLVFARFPICFWSKSGWNEDRISSCTNYLQSPLTEFDQKIYSSHQVKCKYLILHQNTKDPSQYQIHNPITPQCWFMLFAMRQFLSWIHALFSIAPKPSRLGYMGMSPQKWEGTIWSETNDQWQRRPIELVQTECWSKGCRC